MRRAHDGRRRHRRRDREPDARDGRPASTACRCAGSTRPVSPRRAARSSPTCGSRAASSRLPARRRRGSVDVYLGFDLLGAAPTRTSRRRTRTGPSRWCPRARCRPAGWSSTPGSASRSWPRSSTGSTRSRAASTTSTSTPSCSPSALFGDHMTANTLALGAAYQRGLLPLSAGALEQAIRLNGAAVEKNLAAFAWGRAVVADPDAVERATAEPEPPVAGALRGGARARDARRGRRRAASCAGSWRSACPSSWPTGSAALRPPLRGSSCDASRWPSRSARPATASSPRPWPATSSS